METDEEIVKSGTETDEAVVKVEVIIDGENEVVLVKKEEAVTSDEEWMDVDDSAGHSDEGEPKSATKKPKILAGKADKKGIVKSAKKSPVKSAKKQTKKVSSAIVDREESHVESMKLPTRVAQTPTKRSLMEKTDEESDATPAKTPRRTARMSVMNSDIMELKKLKSGQKHSKGEIEVVIEDHVGVEKGRRRKKTNETDVGKSMDEQSEISTSGKKKGKGQKLAKASVEESLGDMELIDIQIPESSAKKKSNVSSGESAGSKKTENKIISEETESSSGKKMKTAGNQSLLKNTARKSGPSAQERLNMKITQRIKEKRKSHHIDSE